MATRPRHLEYIQDLGGKVKVAGATLDENSNPKASAFVVEFDNEEQAHEFVLNDPYSQVELFSHYQLSEYRPSLGAWVN